MQRSANAVCEACDGHGYHTRYTKNSWRPKGFCGIEIKQCDACYTCKSDKSARIKFVEELECHGRHALQQLADILDKPSLGIVLREILDEEEANNESR